MTQIHQIQETCQVDCLIPACYGLNVCVPLKFICWDSNLQGDGIWRWGLVNGTSALIKEIPESSLASSTM